MAEAVVDQLEVVEVDEEKGGLCPFEWPDQSPSPDARGRGSVRETGQRVMQCRMCELLARFSLDALAGR